MKNGNKYLKIFLYVFIVVLCFGYLRYKSTYASYETNVKGNINPQIADWRILVNGVEATTSDDVLELDSRSFIWECPSSGVRDQKVGPGCLGVMELDIDASNTEVAVLYEFDIKDKSVAPEKILKITDIQFSNNNFYKTDVSKYSGYLSLDADYNIVSFCCVDGYIIADFDDDSSAEIPYRFNKDKTALYLTLSDRETKFDKGELGIG